VKSTRRRDPDDGLEPKQRNGAAHLKAALARLLKRTDNRLVPLPTPPDPWSHHVEARLTLMEQKFNGQNRLLIMTIISVTADLLYGLAKP
jgi:hypothetical protein